MKSVKKNKYMRIGDVMKYFKKKYYLPDNCDDALRKKIEDTCQNIVVSYNGKRISLREKTSMYFKKPSRTKEYLEKKKSKMEYKTYQYKEEDINLIENEEGFKMYLYNTSLMTNEQMNEYKENVNRAKEINKSWLHQGETIYSEEYETEYSYSPCEIQKKVQEMMLNALYNKFFTPINTELLEEDLNIRLTATDGSETAESIASAKRLLNDSNYYEEKPLDNRIVQQLAREIAKEVINQMKNHGLTNK